MKNPEELIQSCKYIEALNILENQIQTQPDNSDILSKIGYCLLMTGMVRDAEKYFKKASALCNDAWVWQQYGYILYKLGKLTESVKAIKRAVKYDPENVWYFHQLAFLFSKAGNYENSLYYIDKAMKLADTLQNYNYSELLELKAGVYENIDKNKSLDIYLGIIESNRDNPFSYDKASNLVIDRFKFSKYSSSLNESTHEYNKATLLLRNGFIDEAIELYKKVIKNNKYCYPAYLGIAQALYEKKFGILEIVKSDTPKGISDLFRNYNQLNNLEKNIINASVAPFANFIDKLNKKNSQFYIVPVDVRLVDYPANRYLKDKKYQNMPFCTLRGIGGDNGYVGIERLRDILWDIPDNTPFIPACAAHEYAHLVWCLLDNEITGYFEELYNDSKENNFFISNYSAYNVEEFFAEYYAHYAKLLATGKPIPDNPIIKRLQALQ